MGRCRRLRCLRGCCYDRPHPTPVFVAMYSKMSSHLHRIRSTPLPTTPLLPSFCVFPDYQFVCLVWRVIIDFQFSSAFTELNPKEVTQKNGNTVHILYLSSTSDSLSCSLQYMVCKLFRLKKASTGYHSGICPTCDVQFFDREGSKRWWRGRRCFHHKQMDYSPWCTLFNRLAVFNLA